MEGVPLFSWVDHIRFLKLKVLKGNMNRTGHRRGIGAFEFETVTLALPKKQQVQFCAPVSAPEIGIPFAKDRHDNKNK